MTTHRNRKRVEALLQDLGTKSEKKKSEVRYYPFIIDPVTYMRQIVALQTAAQQQQQRETSPATTAPVSA
jgi:hypothetical protein